MICLRILSMRPGSTRALYLFIRESHTRPGLVAVTSALQTAVPRSAWSCQSVRSAVMGLSLAARFAGMRIAATTTTRSIPVTIAKIIGSCGSTL